MRRILAIILMVFLTAALLVVVLQHEFIFSFVTEQPEPAPLPPPVTDDPHGPDSQAPEPQPDIRSVTLAAVGDVMAHLTQVEQAYLGEGRYDFSPSFGIVLPHLRDPDLTVGNLETTMAGSERGYSGFPLFNTPADLAVNLKEAGFDLMVTANNHALDMGVAGLKQTIRHLRQAGLQNFGTYLEQSEREKPLLVNLDGIKIAFLGYTFSTNGLPVPAGYEYTINYIDNFYTIEPIVTEIRRARDSGADLVVLYMHWGHEYWFTPNEQQRDLAVQLAAAGADLILGSHPHVIQPLEWVFVEDETGASRQVLVAYSMGNFVSNQFHWPPYIPTPAVQYGLVVEVEITKDMSTGETFLSDAGYEITWVHRGWRHRVLPLSELLNSPPELFKLTPEEHQNVIEGYREMVEVVEKYDFSRVAIERPF